MKKFITLCMMFAFFVPIAQENHPILDMTYILADMQDSWSIGNGTDPETGEFYGEYFEVHVYPEDDIMNMNGFHLEIMNAKVVVFGDTINSHGGVTKRFFGISELEVMGQTLSVPEPVTQDFKMYPNPATTEVNLQGAFIKDVTVFNVEGKIIKKVDVNSISCKIYTEELSDGLYLIRVMFDSGASKTKRLIVR